MKTSLALIFCALSLSLSAGTATAKTRHAKASPKARHAAQASGNALPLKADGCAHFTAGKGSYRFSVPDEGKALHSSASGVLTAPDGETLYMARGIDTDSGAAFHFADLPETLYEALQEQHQISKQLTEINRKLNQRQHHHSKYIAFFMGSVMFLGTLWQFPVLPAWLSAVLFFSAFVIWVIGLILK